MPQGILWLRASLAAIVFALCWLAAPWVFAAPTAPPLSTVTHGPYSIPGQTGAVLEIPKWSPGGGATLDSCDIEITVSLTPSYGYEKLASDSNTYWHVFGSANPNATTGDLGETYWRQHVYVREGSSIDLGVAGVTSLVTRTPDISAPFDGTKDFAGTSGWSASPGTYSSTTTWTLSTSSELALVTGLLGTWTLELQDSYRAFSNGQGGWAASLTNNGPATSVVVTYHVSP